MEIKKKIKKKQSKSHLIRKRLNFLVINFRWIIIFPPLITTN